VVAGDAALALTRVASLSEGWRIQRDTPGYVAKETAETMPAALAAAGDTGTCDRAGLQGVIKRLVH